MSYNTSMDTITVNDVTYDVERSDHDSEQRLTLTLDGEEVFEGLTGTLGYEQYDQELFDPRDWSNVGTMAVSYRGYDLGDENIADEDFQIQCDRCDGNGERPFLITNEDGVLREFWAQCAKCQGAGDVQVDPATYYRLNAGARVVIGLFVYEHSGITMSAGQRVGEVLKQGDIRSTGRFIGDDAGWDTSFVGFIYDTPKAVKDCIGDNATDEDIERALRQEVAIYASYLEGDVTCYMVDDTETNYNEGCGGYVGDHKHCESECFEAMEQAIIKRLAELDERAEWAARDTITK